MQKQNFVIDKITESIEGAANGHSYETEVLSVTSKDLKTVLKKSGWRFNWKTEFKYLDRQLYKLTIKGDKTIQGLIIGEYYKI
ncbi:hypothetical protein [Parafilimonas terrae]|uniref:Uncharacterized protein n=1 Tax=Parafilimonas terrae TaxID=1465490 RepID=A0A1I5R7T5_9BACT|nr:hypothetical protein [Parafilimonas terrae]SFP54470.1 hypothetical protein SAMN05444277_101115 [Parafilimonas terrae]